MNRLFSTVIVFNALAAAVALTGCNDPLVGRWEGKEDSAVDLDIEADGDAYRGEGHIYLCDDTQCFLCPFDFEAQGDGERAWEVEGEFTGDCSSAGSFEGIECDMNDAGDELECDLGGGNVVEYEKAE